ncbi:hypothetical protein GCM10011581_22020 [Saccharopolyspora subtropica]|uniref:YbaB/EbfC DNA-binding family protein n=1 Tax=Saccharopolyspora thermophila TaxID=89367 RepID=A0A917NCM5_9PSEU|nr:hypothetical protein [Saccharopolyspora subtropica]GGI84481.1 hypothetical protein GCM10011581_22020 [Saccharopolyspora subtropica]
MDADERTIDDLIAIAEGIPERPMDLAASMDRIRGTAEGEGISLEVDLQGMLVELELTDQALALGPEGLAAELTRLSEEASFDALQQGLVAIEVGCGAKVATEVGEYLNSLFEEQEAEAPDEFQGEEPAPESWTRKESW